MIPIKSDKELDCMRAGGIVLARILKKICESVKPGITTADINKVAEELMRGEKVTPAFKGYRGYPASICVSVNEEIVHGIPGEREIVEGDLVSLDLGIIRDGFFSDAATTVAVGKISERSRNLLEVTKESLTEGVQQARVNNSLSDISRAIQNYVERYGFSVVRQFVGHGIGRNLHEDPELPNFVGAHKGPVLKKGMVLAIEPMVNTGSWECRILPNGWTAVTKDGLASAHFEHTVAITEHGPEIMTA
jgi:methionyl aminopeptidase